jgi:hypothetical protein
MAERTAKTLCATQRLYTTPAPPKLRQFYFRSGLSQPEGRRYTGASRFISFEAAARGHFARWG